MIGFLAGVGVGLAWSAVIVIVYFGCSTRAGLTGAEVAGTDSREGRDERR